MVAAAFASLHLMTGEAVVVSWWAAKVQVYVALKASLGNLSQESSCSHEVVCQA